MLDCKTTYEGASLSQASLTMHCDSLVVFNCLNKLFNNKHRWSSSLGESKGVVLDSIFWEFRGIVGILAEPDDSVNFEFLEDFNIVFGHEKFVLNEEINTP